MNRLHWHHWSLAVWLTVILTITVSLTVLGITAVSVQQQQQAFQDEMEQQATLLLDALSAGGAAYLQEHNQTALANIMTVLGQEQHILVSGRYYDANGRIIADAYGGVADGGVHDAEADPFGLRLIASESTLYELEANQLVAGRAITAQGELLGAVSVGLPLAPLREKVTQVRNQGLALAVLTAVLGSLMTSIFIHRSFNRPLRKLMQAAEQIAAGDLMQPIRLKRNDELGRLALTMDKMRGDLLALYENLEHQVAERTAELQSSEARYRLVVASISDAVYTAQLEKDGRFYYTYLSPNFQAITGYSLDKFHENPLFWLTYIHPDDRPIFQEQLSHFREGKNSDIELRFVHGERGVIWLRNSGQVTPAEDEASLTIYGVVSDVSEHKEAELALAKQIRLFENLVVVAQATTGHPSIEQTLQSILNVAIMLTDSQQVGRSSLFIFNTDGSVATNILARGTHTFQRMERFVTDIMSSGLAGWVAQHHQTALIFDTAEDDRWLKSAEDEGTARSALSVPIMSGNRLLAILTLAHPDVGHFTMDHAYLLEAATGQLSLALRNAQMHDEQIQQAERQRTLYETLKAVGSHLDPHSVAQAAVTAVAELTQWPAVEILLPHPDTAEQLVVVAAVGPAAADLGATITLQQGIIGRACRTQQIQYAPNVNADGDYVPSPVATVQSELAVPLTHSGRLLGALNIINDELDAFDEEDIRLADSLAEAIALALDNARLHRELRQAKEAAEQANRAKSEFISVVSHELKTPMTSIRGYADLILTGLVGPLSENQTNFLTTINDNVSRMQTLVSDLTDISRIESGQFSLEPQAVAVADVVTETIRIMQRQFEAKQHTIKIETAVELPPVWVDRNRLVQIMNNLLSNACKYTPPNGLITVHLAPLNRLFNGRIPPELHDIAEEMVCISVADTGLGIAPEDQGQLFQKFFRAHDKSAQQELGTGLGLSITKNLVELQNGRIWFESEYRQGTTFHVAFPIHEPADS